LRISLAIGFLLLALIAFKNPAEALSRFTPPSLISMPGCSVFIQDVGWRSDGQHDDVVPGARHLRNCSWCFAFTGQYVSTSAGSCALEFHSAFVVLLVYLGTNQHVFVLLRASFQRSSSVLLQFILILGLILLPHPLYDLEIN